MAETLYASFADPDQAAKAAGALLDHGVKNDDLSLIHNGAGGVTSGVVDPDYRTASAGEPGGTVTAGDYTVAQVDEDEDDLEAKEKGAKHGLTTTSGEDAAKGAAKGAGIGLGVGAVAALASIFIPGVGLVVGSGALATALAGAAGATAAGAVAGGATGYLKDQGVPEEHIQYYSDTLQQGGAMLAVSLPSGDVDRARAEDVLAKYGASNVNAYGGAMM